MSRVVSSRARQRGLSLVEMMVGLAVGLFIIAAAATLVTMQLGDNRRILLEAQVQQDLRATADIIVRELRRAGHWSRAENGIWVAGGTPARNGYLGLTNPSGSEIGYDYRRSDGGTGPFGFKLDTESVNSMPTGVIKTKLAGAAGWQELTDKNVLAVDSLDIAIATDPLVSVRLPCAQACPSPVPAGQPVNYCWPEISVRSVVVTITGHAVSDPAVQRTVRSEVRLRNDEVRFNAGNALNPQVCPA